MNGTGNSAGSSTGEPASSDVPRTRGDRLFTRERITVYPIIILVLSVVLWLVTAVLGDPPLAASGSALFPDFLAYWTGGNLFAGGQANAMYDPSVQSDLQRAAVPGLEGGLSWYVAPPFVAALYAPLGALPYTLAASLFAVLSLGALVLCGRLVLPIIRRDPDMRARLFLVAVAAAPPVFEAIGSGQNSPFLLLLWLLAWQQLEAGRDASAGALLALTIFKPHLILLIPVWFAMRRQWRALVSFVGVSTLVFVVPLMLLPSGTFGAWRSALTSDTFGQEVQSGQTWKMESVSALLTDVVGWSRIDVVVLVLGAAALAWWLSRLERDPLRDLAVVAAVTVCCAPHVMLYDALILLIPLAWLAGQSQLRNLRWPLLALFIVQFTTAIRHVVAESVPLLGWFDWAWAAVPLAIVLVALQRLTTTQPSPGPIGPHGTSLVS